MPYSGSTFDIVGLPFSFDKFDNKKELSIFITPSFKSPKTDKWMYLALGREDESNSITYAALFYDGAELPIRRDENIFETSDINDFIADAWRDEICNDNDKNKNPFRYLRELIGC